MIHHIFKLVWQRKSRHLLLSLEILLAFLVVFALCAAAGRYYQLFQLPTGLNHQARWLVSIEGQSRDELTQATAATTTNNAVPLMSQYQRALQQIPALQQVSFIDMPLYDLSGQDTILQRADTQTSLVVNLISVSDDFFAAADLQLIAGRSFNQTDNGAAHQPVVIDQRLADAMFPGIDPIGQLMRNDATSNSNSNSNSNSYQIIGLVKALRTQGELMSLAPTVITRLSEQSVPAILLLQLASGTDRAIEQQLLQQLKQVRSDWSYKIEPLTQKRQSILRTQMIPLLILAVLSAFLLSMVAFGLFGVLWQHTSQRIPELGLRRAIGATAGNIYWQIIAEQLLLNLLAVSVALLLLVQLPLTGVLGEQLNWSLFLMASTAATLIICLLSLICALYPAWRASRLTPTEALHYE